ncbi:MAG: class B sortase [Lachnoclostridium sp.]|nr:class B sortase [Lachnospira sp.]MCM1248598.1 class B sortase [Lachnoclostridium sp.]
MKKIRKPEISEGRKNTGFFVVAGIGGAVMVLTAVVILLSIYLDYKGAEDTYAHLQEKYVVIKKVEIPADRGADRTQSQSRSPQEIPNQNRNQNPDWWYEDVSIDFTRLQEENPEIIGWILFDNIEGLSYPILYSGDNEKYLRTDIYGKSTTAGCIFMEGACTPDFEDCHTILYGHNMRNSSMFGTLKQFKTKNFYDDHQYFTIYTKDGACRYRVFSFYDVEENDSVYSVSFAPNEEFQQFVDKMAEKSYQNTGITVSKEDKVMTLSTCSVEGIRFVVHALRIDKHPYK